MGINSLGRSWRGWIDACARGECDLGLGAPGIGEGGLLEIP
jgi:hypothetical protein